MLAPLWTLEEHRGPWELVRNAGSQAPSRPAECNSACEDDPRVIRVHANMQAPLGWPEGPTGGKEAPHQAGSEPD